jgi:single-strand DNA-binding protein
MNLNKVMLIGNLTRDPEVRQTANGKSVASFAVATNMVWQDASGNKQERAEFTNVVAWGKLADICGRYLKKGGKIYVEGRLQTRDWTGKDGIKRYSTEVVLENMIMLDSRGSGSAPFVPGTPSAPQASSNSDEISYDSAFGQANGAEEEEIKVENIPF